MPEPPEPRAYDAAVAGWRTHLRSGGRTPWADFTGTGDPMPGPSPSSVHLELIRRLDPSVPDGAGLADLVLSTPAPGRGRVDVPLSWPTPTAYGAPRVDPARLPAAELLRLALGVLDRLVGHPPAPAVPTPRWWSRRIGVEGPPLLREALRHELRAKGWQVTPRARRQVLLSVPLPEAMTLIWAQRVARGSTGGWGPFLERTATGDLPPALRAGSEARRTARFEGDIDTVWHEATRHFSLPTPALPGGTGIELIRRLNPVLGTRMDASTRRAAAPHLLRLVSVGGDPMGALAVPVRHRGWFDAHGAARDDYARGARPPGDAEVLELALRVIAATWTERT